jgi:hypothetical protein
MRAVTEEMPMSPEAPIDQLLLQQGNGETIHRPAKLIRIAAMVRELLGEVRQCAPDAAGRKRLREIYERALAELREGLSDELMRELDTLTVRLDETPSESEIRLAQAQLVGWLEGLFQGIQAALWAQQMQAQAHLEEMRRRALPPGPFPVGPDEGRRGPGQYL